MDFTFALDSLLIGEEAKGVGLSLPGHGHPLLHEMFLHEFELKAQEYRNELE